MRAAEQGLGGLHAKLLLIHGWGDLKRLFKQAEKIAFGHAGGFSESFYRQRFGVVAFDIGFGLVDAVVLGLRYGFLLLAGIDEKVEYAPESFLSQVIGVIRRTVGEIGKLNQQGVEVVGFVFGKLQMVAQRYSQS